MVERFSHSASFGSLLYDGVSIIIIISSMHRQTYEDNSWSCVFLQVCAYLFVSRGPRRPLDTEIYTSDVRRGTISREYTSGWFGPGYAVASEPL